MVYVFDPETRGAMDALERGDTEPLAQIIEEGHTRSLHHFLESHPERRQMIAKALRKGSARGRGPRPKDNRVRDRHIASLIAYWIGYGAPGWQGEAEPDSCFHRAAKDLEGSGIYLSAGRVRNIFNSDERNAYTRFMMTESFLSGVEDGIDACKNKAVFMENAFNNFRNLQLFEAAGSFRLLQMHANSMK